MKKTPTARNIYPVATANSVIIKFSTCAQKSIIAFYTCPEIAAGSNRARQRLINKKNEIKV